MLVTLFFLRMQEGTTQGDPLSMPLHALATVPLIRRLPYSVLQSWYADDASSSGRIDNLRHWWNVLASIGPQYGYFANTSKTWLITKQAYHDKAKTIFRDTNINITTEGRPHLGAPLGSPRFVQQLRNGVVNFSTYLKLQHPSAMLPMQPSPVA